MISYRASFSFLCYLLVVFVMTACGGGGSSSEGGGNSSFDITPYVGEWLISLNAVVTFQGQSGISNTTNQIIIDPQGKFIDPDADPQCLTGIDGRIIDSNPFNWSATYNCTGEFRSCRINESGSLRLTGADSATGEITQIGTCGASNEPLRVESTFTALKQSQS